MTFLEICNGIAQVLTPLAWCILFGGVVYGINRAGVHAAQMEKAAFAHIAGAECEACEYYHQATEEIDDDDTEEQPEEEED